MPRGFVVTAPCPVHDNARVRFPILKYSSISTRNGCTPLILSDVVVINQMVAYIFYFIIICFVKSNNVQKAEQSGIMRFLRGRAGTKNSN